MQIEWIQKNMKGLDRRNYKRREIGKGEEVRNRRFERRIEI